MKSGMKRDGSKYINGEEYLRQRVEDAMITPIGSIPLDRSYGSKFHEIIDENVTDDLIMTIYENMSDMFLNPSNDLDDCNLINVSVKSLNDVVEIDARLSYNGTEIDIKGLRYG